MDKKKDEIILIVEEFKKRINKQIKLEKLILFGSRAKGTPTKKSDVDLLLVSSDFKGKKYFRRSPSFYLMWDYPHDIDIICLTPDELNEKRKQIGMIREAVEEGIEI